ncbi:MAG: HAMP domain-containing histidine kinase [Oscillibacter sp.]|nr:HAMP domain-containing histidine kinase [Oscillibacter sp.]
MKFRVKMTLWMLAVLSVLFGIGGSLLISGFFQDSLEREKDAAFASYRMAWSALRIVNGLDPYLDAGAISRTMEQLCEQNGSAWTALCLATEEGILYETGPSLELLLDGKPPSDACLIRLFTPETGRQWLALSGAVETNGETLYLHTTHDVSALYAMRQSQQRTYLRVFGVMAVICAIACYTMSRLLTAPLTGLSRASRAIASGRFSSRASVRGEDEIAAVSRDFNLMAEKMEQTIAELHQAMERQERFVGSFAHEMKTPMTSLIGYADLLRSGKLTAAEQAEAADYVFSEGKRLSNLSKKLLELLVVRERDLPFIEASPADLVEEFTTRLRPLLAPRQITVLCGCQPGECLMEPDLVWSLLLNLADNAQKAVSNGGEIRFRQEMLPDGCRIQVMDDGRGIPEKSLEHLTEAFYRVDKARARKQGGFGLGLALCQEIAAVHNGSIRFANRADAPHGACVTVELRGGRTA